MTCIVGLVQDETVYLGGDSAGIAGWDLTLRADPKVFRNGPFLIGVTGSFRMGQLLRYALVPPARPPDMDIMRYMTTVFADAVRDCLKAGGYAKKTSEQEEGGVFLVGYAGRLLRIDSDYQVGEALEGYTAVGSGDAVAQGALYASVGQSPRARVSLALHAAERWNIGVRAPFVIEALEPEPEPIPAPAPAPAEPEEAPAAVPVAVAATVSA